MNLADTAKHCLWSCDFLIEIWKRIITVLIPVYPRAMYIVVKDKPLVYEQEDVVEALVMLQIYKP